MPNNSRLAPLCQVKMKGNGMLRDYFGWFEPPQALRGSGVLRSKSPHTEPNAALTPSSPPRYAHGSHPAGQSLAQDAARPAAGASK
jgi:hypothetical protein